MLHSKQKTIVFSVAIFEKERKKPIGSISIPYFWPKIGKTISLPYFYLPQTLITVVTTGIPSKSHSI